MSGRGNMESGGFFSILNLIICLQIMFPGYNKLEELNIKIVSQALSVFLDVMTVIRMAL